VDSMLTTTSSTSTDDNDGTEWCGAMTMMEFFFWRFIGRQFQTQNLTFLTLLELLS
jgi:hypothetical protein